MAANPGTPLGPLTKVASGGELSRFMLALKVALPAKGSAPTLIFDEIDTGVGGAVADAIGQRLARLSAVLQVLAVTHSPQVAARAASHWLITKMRGGDPRATTGPRHHASSSCKERPGARRLPACCPAPRSPMRRGPRPSACWTAE